MLNILYKIKIIYLILLAVLISILEFILARKILVLEYNINLKLVSILILLSILLTLSIYFFNKLIYIKEKEFNNVLNKIILDNIFIKKYREVEKYSDGDIITLLISDTNIVSKSYVLDLSKIIIGMLSFISATIFGFLTSWQLTIFTLILSSLSILIPKYFEKILEENYKFKQENKEEYQSLIMQIYNNKINIRVFKANNFIINLFKKIYFKFTKANFISMKFEWKLYSLNIASGLLFDVLTLLFSFYLITINKLSFTAFISFSILTKNFTWIFYDFPTHFISFKKSKISLKRIMDLILKENKKEINLENFKSLEFKNICFSYDKVILQNFNFKLDDKSEKILIKGESGSGKSTFLKILLGLYEIDEGQIFLNDKIVNQIPNNIFSYVPQKIELFNGSIKNNILLGRNIDNNKFNEVIKICKLKNLELEKDINIDKLSSGEKQKIGLARALVEDKILVLDEIFANLDEDSEKKISKILEENIDKYILVSHRYKYLNNIDKIINMQ